MNRTRYLIVNADDFGQNSSVNRGIVEAHVEGIVTSTSMMVRWPAAQEAVDLLASVPELDVGLHLDLGEWRLVDGEWKAVYEVVPLADAAAVQKEVRRQMHVFQELLGRMPTHFDSHQHVHLREPARSVIASLAAAHRLPLRSLSSPAHYVGDFYGQNEDGSENLGAISVEALVGALKHLEPGVHELACHPGRDVDFDTMYKKERDVEVDTLCDARIRTAVSDLGVTLCTFPDLSSSEAAAIEERKA